MLATYHNLYFLRDFVARIRESIRRGEFLAFKRDFLVGLCVEAASESRAGR